MKLRLTHVEGSRKGTVDNFDVPVLTVGRDPSNVLAFDPVKDDRVSTKHAALSEQGGSLVVTDLGSRNGTLVNGKKIQGPTPVPSGSLVQFGENGPMIMVAYETAAAAAPAPVAKKGGGGCAIVAVIVIFLVAIVAVVLFLVLRGKGGHANPWTRYAPGTVFEISMETKLEKPAAMTMKSDMKETIVSRTDDAVKVKIETTTSGTTSSTEQEIPLHAKGEESKEKPLEEKSESITVPAGTFDCHYTKFKTGDNTTETWTSEKVPVPVKSVTTMSGASEGTSTMLLVKIDEK